MSTKPNSGTVSVSRELLERLCKRPGKESLAVNHADIIDRGRAQAELRAILAHPADQQGEPYRYIVRSTGGGSLSCKPDAAHESLWQDEGHARRYYASGKELHADPKVFWPEEYQIVPLYRHAQPATAKVVLPVRKRPDPYCYDQGGNANVAGWNACLDEVAKLNGINT